MFNGRMEFTVIKFSFSCPKYSPKEFYEPTEWDNNENFIMDISSGKVSKFIMLNFSPDNLFYAISVDFCNHGHTIFP